MPRSNCQRPASVGRSSRKPVIGLGFSQRKGEGRRVFEEPGLDLPDGRAAPSERWSVRLLLMRPTMRLSLAFVVLVGLAANLTACQGTPLVGGQADALAARVPLNHRASGATCPAGRGPGSTSATFCPADGGTPEGGAIVGQRLCSVDGDCTAGTNGRCFLQGGPVTDCGTVCSYDACGSDSDCPGDEPCECRTSASDAQANSCLTGGNCRLDSDCGPGGYCSPSQVDSFCFCPSPA